MRRTFWMVGLGAMALLWVYGGLTSFKSAGGAYTTSAQGSESGGNLLAYFDLPGNAEDDDIRGKIEGLLRSEVAKGDSLDIAMFSFSQDSLEKAIWDLIDSGVKVQVIMDDAQANGSKNPCDNFGNEPKTKQLVRDGKLELKVNFQGNDVEMHHRFAAVPGKWVLTGSFNWTQKSADDTFENIVIVRDPTLANRFASEFDRMWATPNLLQNFQPSSKCP